MSETPPSKKFSPFARFNEADIFTKTAMILGLIVALFAISLLVSLILALVTGDSDNVANIVSIVRDLFIILLAMQGILIGIAIIVLILQLASTVNLLQNEISPLIKSLQETAATVKGTSEFLSENITVPVIESKAWMAGISTFWREVRGLRTATHKQAAPPGEKSNEASENPQ